MTGGFECECDHTDRGKNSSWVGLRCDTCAPDFYPVGVCNATCTNATCGMGICTDQGVCDCFRNETHGYWGGEKCDQCMPKYFPVGICKQYCDDDETCKSRGECGAGGYCECDDGFQGLNCSICSTGYYNSSIGFCDLHCDRAANCSSNGECTLDANQDVCHCYPDYFGDTCDVYCRASKTCNNRGTCDGTGQCVCNKPFTGEGCIFCLPDLYPPGLGADACTVYCKPEVHCSGNGRCDWQSGECFCNPGWLGENCSDEYVTPTKVEAPDMGAAAGEDDECTILEIGGVCLGWLLIALLLLLLSLSCLAAYLLSRKKKKPERRIKSEKPLLDHEDIGGWGGGDMGGMDPEAKKAEEQKGLNLQDMVCLFLCLAAAWISYIR